jgi:hypothetical protein
VKQRSAARPSSETLKLDLNQFSSTISPKINKLSDVEILSLGTNLLSGTVPETITSLTDLKVFNVKYNDMFSGNLSSFVGSFEKLTQLDIQRTEIDGTIPTVS